MEVYLLEQLPLGCIASNEHFANTLNIGSRTVGRYIKELLDDHYLILEDFNGNRRKLRVNLDRLEPRQIDQVAGHFGQPTSPNWPYTIVTYYNQFNKDSISRDALRSKNLMAKQNKAKSSQKQVQVQPQTQLLFAGDPQTAKPQNKTQTKSKTKNKAAKTTKSNIPLPFTSDAFKAKWSEWLTYYKEIKKPYGSNQTIRQLFTRLARYEETFVIELIEESIASGWKRLVFQETPKDYQKWLTNKQKEEKEKQMLRQGTGTKAKPKQNLISATQESNSIYHQLQNLEKQQATFETYPIHLLQTFAEQLRGMWKRAKAVEMHASEIGRINTLGHSIAELIEAKTKSSDIKNTQSISGKEQLAH
ncbi:MAG TPA: transcriptional regulator [Microscillaceae bacterium]|nr:transcriptional regulator [Microscillaceae bacterium]